MNQNTTRNNILQTMLTTANANGFSYVKKQTTHMKKGLLLLLTILSLIAISNFSFGQAQTIGSFPSMIGGFETGTPGSLSSATVTTGTQLTNWSYATAAQNTISLNSTTVRSGSKSLDWANSSTSATLISPTAPTTGIAASTSYVVQFYYWKNNAGTARACNAQITADATANLGTAVSTGVLGTSSASSSWTKVAIAVTSGAGAATPRYGFLQFKPNGGSFTSVLFDDVCIYAGSTADVTAPSAATSPSATGTSGSTVDVTWTGSVGAGDGGGYVIVRSTSATAVTLNTNGIYGVGNTSATGSGTVVAVVAGTAGTNTFSDASLTPGTTYYYSIFAVDKAFNYAAAATCNATPSASLPNLTLSPTTLSAFANTSISSQSTSQNFTITGANLTGAPGNITVSAPSSDFQVSNDNSSWGSTATIAYSSATLNSSNTVYVRFSPQAGGAKSSNVTFSGGGLSAPPTIAVSGTGYGTYTWSGGNSAWTTTTNWTPTRTTPNTLDILQFNNGATVTITGVITETEGQIIVSNNTLVTLQANAAATVLTIGGTGQTLSVASGSQLNISGANSMNFNIPTGATASITGSMDFSGAANTFTAADASGITFNNGAVLTQNTSSTGNIFGSGTANSVVFASGSTFAQVVGSNPFQKTQPASVVVFNHGSLYRFLGNIAPSSSGRTYANIEINSATFSQSGGGGTSWNMDNLTITQGALTIAATSTTNILGNISVANGSTLNLGGTSPVSLGSSLNTSSTITVGSTGTLLVGATAQTLNIPSGKTITLSGNISVNTAGVLTVDGILDLGSSVISGTGTFTLNAGGTLNSSHSTGLGSNITTTSKTFTAASNYVFNAATTTPFGSLTIGNPLNLTINNTVTLDKALTYTGTVLVTGNGSFNLNANNIINTGGNVNILGPLTVGTNTNTISGTGAFTLNKDAAVVLTNSTTTNLLNTVTVSSNTGLIIGMAVTGTNIPSGTYVTGISGTTITLSSSATGTSSTVTLTFTSLGGIVTSSTTGLDGNITVSGTKTYNDGADYTFNAATTAPFSSGQSSPVTGNNFTIGANVSLNKALTVNNTLTFNTGVLTLGTNNLIIPSGGSISGSTSAKYIVTNSTGTLRLRVPSTNTNITFPIGTSSSLYNPIILNNNGGTADDYRINVASGAPSNTPIAATNFVQNTYTITEATANGSNLAITTQWNASSLNTQDEGSTFNHSGASVGLYNGTGTSWTTHSTTIAGSNPYTAPSSTFTQDLSTGVACITGNFAILAPTTQASAISFGTPGTSMTVSWTRGDGGNVAVFVKDASGTITNPSDGTGYTANSNWNTGSPSGTQLGSSGYYCVYNGTGTSVGLTNLEIGHTYYVQAFEYNGTGGTSVYYTVTATNNPNNQLIFTTPTVTTGSATNFATTSITLNGTINANAASTATSFDYGTTTGYTAGNVAATPTPVTGTSGTAVSLGLTSLTDNTLYHFRAKGINSAGTTNGSDATFTTLSNAPSVGSATAITLNGFTANWTISNTGSASITYTVDVSDDNTFATGVTTISSISGTSQAFTGLSNSTVYYYRVKAVNAGGNSAWSSTSASFTTLSSEPTTAASALSFTAFDAGSISLSWTNGNGANRIVVVKSGSAPTGPTDGTGYSANAAYGSGSTTAAGSYVVHNGSGNSVTVTGLSAATTYYFAVYEFNGSAATSNYYLSSPAAGNQYTLATEPTSAATSVNFTSIGGTAFTINWTSGNGANRIVLVKHSAAVDSDPVDGTTYSANSVFGSGTQIGSGNYVVYKGAGSSVAITGLIPGDTYYVSIYELNGSGGQENYLITAPATGNQATSNAASIVVSGTFSSFGTVAAGGSSSEQSVTVEGTGLSADITVTAPTGFQISTTSGSGFSSSVNLTQTAGAVITTAVYVIFTPSSAGAFSDNISATSTGATQQDVAVAGTAVALEPTSQASAVTFSSLGITSYTVNFTNGNGSHRLVIARASSAVATAPSDNTAYTANAAYASGDPIGSGYVVYNGTGNSVTVTGLSAGTVYHFAVYEFNDDGTGAYQNYNITSAPAGNQTTLSAEPTTQATAVNFTAITGNSATINWTNGDGSKQIVLVRQGSAIATNPTDGASYTANAAYGSGSTVGAGYVAYLGTGTSVNLTGLSATTTYYVAVYSLNGTSGSENYLTATPATGNTTTLSSEPTSQASAVNFTSISDNAFTINWTVGDGTDRIVVVKSGSAVNGNPVDAVTYTDNTVFTSGTQIGTGNYVVYKGTATSVAITGLSAGTTYHVAVYEFNGSGGSENYLLTPATSSQTTYTIPTVTTTSVTAVTDVTATSGGNITLNGGTAITERGIVFSTSINPTTADTKVTDGSASTGSYSSSLTSLSPSTTYHVRAYANNAIGTAYGSDVSFTTLAIEPTTSSSTLSFTSVTLTGMTINWSNGDGTNRIVVVKNGSAPTAPTDAATYTDNTIFGSGNTTGTGSYVVYNGSGSSVSITGLTAATTYYVAIYEYNGTSVSTNYLTSSSLSGIQASASTNFRSITTGNWNSTSTWESFDGTSWVAATSTPTNTDGTITVRNGHIVTVSASVTADDITIDAGGQITVAASQTLTINDGTGTDITVTGYLKNQGTITLSGSATASVSGTYEHALDGGTVPTATWNSGSTCTITGIVNSTTIGGCNQNFYHFTWNCAGQTTTGKLNLGMFNNTIGGNFSFLSAGGAIATETALSNSNAGTGANTITINGNLILTANSTNIFGAHRSGSGGSVTSLTVHVLGNFTMGAVNFKLQLNSGITMSTWNIDGNMSMTAGTIQGNNSGFSELHFTNTGTPHTYSKSGGTLGSNTTIIVDASASLDAGTSIIDGTIGFTLNSGATFTSANIASPGILTTSGTKTINGNLVFNGASAQVFSGGTLAGTPNNVTVNNSAGVTLGTTSPLTVGGTLALTSGNLTTGANTLTINGGVTLGGQIVPTSGTIVYGGSSAQTIAASTFSTTIPTLTINNTSGVTLNQAITIGTNLNLTAGNLNNSSTLTMSTGTTITRNAGSITNAPTLSGTVSVTYNNAAAINSGNELPATVTTLSTAGGGAGVAVSLTSSVSVTTLTVSGSNLTVNSGKTLTVSSAATVSSGKTLQVDGTIINGTTSAWTVTGATLTMNGLYQHTAATGTIPASTWNSGSICEIKNMSSAPGGIGQSFYHFYWNNATQAANISLGGGLTTVNGNLDVQNTNGFDFRFSSNSAITVAIGGNFLVSGSTAKAMLCNGTGNIIVNVAGNINISTGASFSSTNACSVNVKGDIINAGTLNTTNITFSMNGTLAAQNFTNTGVTCTIPNLTLNNTNGLSLNDDLTITGTLTFTNGKITTGSKKVIVGVAGTAGSVSGAAAGKYVYGNLQKFIANTLSTTSTFDIGDATNYAPVSLAFTGTPSGSGSITASTTSGDHAQIASSGIDATKSVNRTWTLTNNSVAGFTSYAPTFTYITGTGDNDATATAANYVIRQYNGSSWLTTTKSGSSTQTTAAATGIVRATGFGDFAIGETTGVPTESTSPTASSICTGSNTSFTVATSSIPTPTVKWQRNTGAGWVDITSGLDAATTYSNFTTTTLNLTGSTTALNGYQYQAVLTNINGSSTPTAATLTVSSISAVGAVSADQTICSGNQPASMTIASATGTILWQNADDAGFTSNVASAGSTALTLNGTTVGALSATKYFRAVVTSGACTAVNSNVITVTVNPTSVGGTATATTSPICAGSSTDITLTGYTGTIQWQTNASGSWANVSGQTNATLTTPTLTTTTAYRAVVTSGVCSSDNSSTATVTVNARPTSVISGSQSICNGTTSGNIGIALTGTQPWSVTYTDGTTPVTVNGISSSPYTFTVSPTATTTYTVTAVSDANCTAQSGDKTGSAVVTVTNKTWTGASSSSWTDASNWCGGVPTAGQNVTISLSATHAPDLQGNVTLGDVAGTNIIYLNGHTLTVNGNISATTAFSGSETSSLILGSGATGTLSFATGTGIDSVTNGLNNLTVSGSVTLATPLHLYGILDIPSSGALNLNDQNLVLHSNATYKTASVGKVNATGYGTLSGATNVSVQRYHFNSRSWAFLTTPLTVSGISDTSINHIHGDIKNNWQKYTYITGPVTSGGLDSAGNNNYSLYRWLGNSGWTTFANTNDDYSLFGNTGNGTADNKAYMIFLRGDRSISPKQGFASTAVQVAATGKLQTGDLDYTLPQLSGTKYALIGNPYAAPIDLNQFALDNTSLYYPNTSGTLTVYYWDTHSSGTGGYTTATYSTNGGWNFAGDNSGTNPHPGYIQSGQAFFVSTNGQSTAHFKESQKDVSFNSNSVFGSKPIGKLKVNMSKGATYIDGILGLFDNNYTKALITPGEDAGKFWGNEEGLGMLRTSKFLSIEARPEISGDDTMFLYMNKMVVGTTYKFDISGQDLPATVNGYLFDKYLNTQTPLNLTQNNSVSFTIDTAAASKSATRFMIVYNSKAPLYASEIKVKATVKAKAAVIDWTVSAEKDVDHYTVESSKNGKDFSAINITQAKNNGNSNYSYTDNQAANGDNYYRIKAISKDGSVQYSNIAKVTIGDRREGISIYPNPVVGKTMNVQLSNIAAGNYEVVLYNANGQQVMEQSLQHAGGSITTTLNLPANLASGIYQLKIGKFVETVIVK